MTPNEVWIDFRDRFVSGCLTREDCKPLVGDMLWDFLERPGNADTLKSDRIARRTRDGTRRLRTTDTM